MADQPTALRIADRCDGLSRIDDAYSEEAYREAAAELRRLHDLLGKANAICRIRAAEIDRLNAEKAELLEAAKLVIAWYEAEDDHSKANFYQRLEMCRDSETALRAAIAKAEAHL